eukprot:m.99225 g.99225  ORF g.99225 m.99225 type:complete len:353 (+) comp8714_c0_seq2:282-1340(+)
MDSGSPATPPQARKKLEEESSDSGADSPKCKPLAEPRAQDFTDTFLQAAVALFQRVNPPDCNNIAEVCITRGFDPDLHWGVIPRGWGGIVFKFAIQGADLHIINLMPDGTHSFLESELAFIINTWLASNGLREVLRTASNRDTRIPGTDRKRIPDVSIMALAPQQTHSPILVVEADVSNYGPTALRKKHAEWFVAEHTQGVLIVKIFEDNWGAVAVLWLRGDDCNTYVASAWIFGRHSGDVHGAMKVMFEEPLDPQDEGDRQPLPPVAPNQWNISIPPTPVVVAGVPDAPFHPPPLLVVPAAVLLRQIVTPANARVMEVFHPTNLVIDLAEAFRASILGCTAPVPTDVYTFK